MSDRPKYRPPTPEEIAADLAAIVPGPELGGVEHMRCPNCGAVHPDDLDAFLAAVGSGP